MKEELQSSQMQCRMFPVSMPGDIWELGQHRLLCADSSDREAMARLMAGERAALCVTSPPYDQQRNYKKKISDWQSLMEGVFGNLPMADDGQILVNLGLVRKDCRLRLYWHDWLIWMESQGYNLYDWYVWDKLSGMCGNYKGHLLLAHEWIFHFNRKAKNANKTMACKSAGKLNRKNSGQRDKNGNIMPFAGLNKRVNDFRVPDSVIRLSQQNQRIGDDIDHPAVYPVALPEFLIPVWTDEADIVYEPFSGSGSTIIAAQNTGRKAYACEIVPEYVDVALIRFGRLFPEVKITLQETGQSFEEVKMERCGAHETE